MRITINGEQHDFADDLSLQELVAGLTLPGERLAIELNREVVRRAEWSQTQLREGDRVEIVHFVGGGSSYLCNASC